MVEFLEKVNVGYFGGYKFLKNKDTAGCIFWKLLDVLVSL